MTTNPESTRDAFLAELTATALGVARRFGVSGASVYLELDLRHEFNAVLQEWRSRQQQTSFTWDERLAALTDAAYRVILDHQFTGAFVDLEMDLWRQFRQIIRRGRILTVAAAPGKSGSNPVRALHLSGVLAIA